MQIVFFFLFLIHVCFGQTEEINTINARIDSLDKVKEILMSDLEGYKLDWIQDRIDFVGVPNSGKDESIVTHAAYQLSYNEEHEQANWVMHMILTDVITGNASRSDDFRVDPLVQSGSSEEKDYFLKYLKADSTYEYDGFGYDRGHLAPSADFRWSKKALSESYFYSNMSPQIGDFNRLKWAELENWMREYVISNQTDLIILTAPVLNDDLPKIERSTNKVSIPKLFVKVALDLNNEVGIGFVLPHEKSEDPLESFTMSIDSVEQLLEYDLFSKLDDALETKIESQSNYKLWLPNRQKDDVKAISFQRFPKKVENTKQARAYVNDGRRHTVGGKVVSTRKHEKGHVFINLDKKFPNQVFSISIFDKSIKNFDYEPEVYLINEEVCFTGKIGEFNGTPSMVVENGKQVRFFSEL